MHPTLLEKTARYNHSEHSVFHFLISREISQRKGKLVREQYESQCRPTSWFSPPFFLPISFFQSKALLHIGEKLESSLLLSIMTLFLSTSNRTLKWSFWMSILDKSSYCRGEKEIFIFNKRINSKNFSPLSGEDVETLPPIYLGTHNAVFNPRLFCCCCFLER